MVGSGLVGGCEAPKGGELDVVEGNFPAGDGGVGALDANVQSVRVRRGGFNVSKIVQTCAGAAKCAVFPLDAVFVDEARHGYVLRWWDRLVVSDRLGDFMMDWRGCKGFFGGGWGCKWLILWGFLVGDALVVRWW